MSDDLAPSLVLGTVVETQSTIEGLMVRVQRMDQNTDIETDWILMSSPMAGEKAGFCFSPEPDDVAVIAFCGERPIVLGFIYPGGVETPSTDPQERMIQSRDGNALVLIDGDKSGITLRDKHKNEITMNADGITIKTDGKFTVEAGGTATIKGATVELNP
jgi:phage baseplate assembly protein gpV